MGCRTVYAVGIPACPHCQSKDYSEGGGVKTSTAGTTVYLAEGQQVSDPLHPDVIFVGPGSGEEDVPEPAQVAEPAPEVKAEAPAKARKAPKAI
jgi:hypothetical protein